MITHKMPVHVFNLDHTLRCGQVFRWQKRGDEWMGIVKGSVISIKQKGDVLVAKSDLAAEEITSYFRLDDDMEKVYRQIGKDKLMKDVIVRYRGLRLARQDPWECLISYVCSINNRIPQIERMIQNLSARFGEEICDGAYTFPSPERLADAPHDELKKCGLGFRTGWISGVAKKVCRGELQLEELKNADYQSAKRELSKISGIGDKVADCVLLYSLDRLEAFPVDVHIRRIVQREYLKNEKASDKEIREWAKQHFSGYAGYAQQYLFYYERTKEM